MIGIPVESQDGIKRATRTVLSELKRQKNIERTIEIQETLERNLLESKIRDR